MIDDDMRALIAAQRLCYAATVAADGRPNLSPKGTIRVWDDRHLFFCDIASPGTRANLAANPWIEAQRRRPVVAPRLPLPRHGDRARRRRRLPRCPGPPGGRGAGVLRGAGDRAGARRAGAGDRLAGLRAGARRSRHARAVARPAGGPARRSSSSTSRVAGRGGRSGPAEAAPHGALPIACGGFLLAVLWFDLMFDVQVRRHPEGDLPEPVLASIAAYYRRVTTDARPMSWAVAVVMVIGVAGAAPAVLAAARRPGPPSARCCWPRCRSVSPCGAFSPTPSASAAAATRSRCRAPWRARSGATTSSAWPPSPAFSPCS